METFKKTMNLVGVYCLCCGNTNFKIVRKSKNLNSHKPLHGFSASSTKSLTHRIICCTHCNLRFANPMPDEAEMIAAYSESEDEIHASENGNRVKSFARVIKWLEADGLIPQKKDYFVVDIGCASGSFLVAGRNYGWETTGYELSRVLSEHGRSKYGVNIRNQIYSSYDFLKKKPDLITLWDVLEHISNPTQLLREIHTSLNPGGTLLINIPIIDSLAAKVLRQIWPFYLDVHVLYFTKTTLIYFLEMNGFEYLKSKPYWQTLSVGYLISRYFKLPRFLLNCCNRIPFRYNLGQQTFVFIKTSNLN